MQQQANLNIGTIGQKLEAARQAKGVTVSEAGRATKILSKFIEAMEADDFGALSAPVYAKSFIRMYAQYLGLDAHQMVNEYVAQHAPKTKNHLTDEVRQNLAKADGVAGETAANGREKPAGRSIFAGANQAIARLSGSGIPIKLVLSAGGAVLLLGLIVLGATQCADDEDEVTAAAAGGAAREEQVLISDGVPDAYLVKPGEVDVEKR